uniref:Inositol 1,4,5-trisphosphate receptor n=1 Tax=Aceria tosichella TaxID=561515 RepID=A0A6G1SGD1_9ACAR
MSLLHIGDIISLFSNGFLSTLGLVDDRCVLQNTVQKHLHHLGAGNAGAGGLGPGGSGVGGPNGISGGTDGSGDGGLGHAFQNHISTSLPTSQELMMPKDPPKKFRDCLFRVCFQNKYDVQNELWRSSHVDEELNKKLYEAAKSEQLSNQEKNQLKRGTVVKYEDTIQLLHIKSNKYVTVNIKAPAPEDKDAIRVYLDSNGNEGSWFKVRSPYKYRSIGEDVICESIALVSDIMGTLNHEDALYLHASNHYLSDNPDCLEINASRQSTSWTVKPFLDYTEDLDDFLKGGDVVRLFHTDQEKFLTMDTYNNDEIQHVFLRSTDRAKATSATSSKALWEVEVVHPDPCRASLARWNSLIRLKHLATERFLAADLDTDPTHDPMREKLRNKGAPVYKLISIEFSYDYATLFEFDSTTTNVNADDYIPIHSNITLKHHPTGTFVHSTSIYIDKDKKKNCMSKVGCAQNKGLDEVFAVIPVSATEIRDLDFVYDACVMLNEALDLIKEDVDSLGRAKAHRKLIELLAEIIHFIANKEDEPRKIERALTMLAENPNRERQKLLREQNVLKLLFDILELENALDEINIDICRLCYKVLRLSFEGYRKNQEYIVKWDKFMQRQFGKNIYAEFTYSALFNSNMNLLEKSVTSADVKVFIDLIRMKRQSTFLDCLGDLCITANGSVCSTTQTLICQAIIFESNDDILVETMVDDSSGNIILSTKHWIPYNDSRFVREVCRSCKPLHDIITSARDGCDRDAFILDYYRHQLDLFSALCVGRQLKAINALSEKLSLKLVQHCIRDGELPCELRASFCKLLLHLYLIKGSRGPVPPINLRRRWTDIAEKVSVEIYDYHDSIDQGDQDEGDGDDGENSETNHELNHDEGGGRGISSRFSKGVSRLMGGGKHRSKPTINRNKPIVDEFMDTMEFVEMYLIDLTAIPSKSIFSNIQRNKLTYEVINLNRELTYFGFYKLKDFLRLAEILLVLLEDEKNQQQLVMKIKTKIIETLQYMADVRLDYMLTSLLAIFKLNQQQQNQQQHHQQQQQKQQELLQQPNHQLSKADNTCNSTNGSHLLNSPICPNGFSSLSSQTAISAIRTDQALDKHLKEITLDNSHGRKFVNVLLQLVKHDCPDLVSASLKLLLNYRSQRQRILETLKRVEFLNASPEIEEKFRKLHPLIERSDKYIRKGRDDNHVAVNDVLLQNSKLVSHIVQHVQYLIRNKDEKQLTRDLLCLLRDIIPLDRVEQQQTIMRCGDSQSPDATGTPASSTAAVTTTTGTTAPPINTTSATSTGSPRTSTTSPPFAASIHHHSQPTVNGVEGIPSPSGTTASTTGNKKFTKAKEVGGQLQQQTMSLSQVQERLDAHGASNLVVELIAMGSTLCEEKVRERSLAIFKDTLNLGIALLEGGNPIIQASIYDKLTRKGEQEKSERFFEVLSNRMSLAQQALSPTIDRTFDRTNEWAQESRLILRFLQLLCEDHNLTMQKFLFAQRNKTSYNLVAKTLVFLNCVCGSKEGSLGHRLGEYIKEGNVDLINQTLRTLTEYCQGPCIDNQRCILMHESNGIDMIRSLILDSIEPLYSLRMDLVLELKDNATKLLLALMESCSDPHHAGRILREPSLTRKLINVAISLYHEQEDYDDIFAGLNFEDTPTSTDGIVMPRDVGHKVFILCHQLVQQYNMLLQSGSGGGLGVGGSGGGSGGGGGTGASTVASASQQAKIITSDEAKLLAQKSEQNGVGSSLDREMYLREAAALYYYESHTAQIEIVRCDRKMERVVFPVPQICEYLTDETKSHVFHSTQQDERGSKIPNFFLKVDDLFEEMKWQRELQTKPILHSIARYMSLWSDLEFKLSFLVTVLVLFCISKNNQFHMNQFSLYTMIVLLKILSLCLEGVTIMHLLSVLINSGIVNKQAKQIALESDVLYHGGYLLVCTLGLIWNPLFYPFLLPPSLIKREETLRNVIKSVTKKRLFHSNDRLPGPNHNPALYHISLFVFRRRFHHQHGRWFNLSAMSRNTMGMLCGSCELWPARWRRNWRTNTRCETGLVHSERVPYSIYRLILFSCQSAYITASLLHYCRQFCHTQRRETRTRGDT